MMDKTRNYLHFPVGFLEGSGLSSTSKVLRKCISMGVMLPITLLLVYLMLKKFWEGNMDVLVVAELIESLTTCAHLLSRKYVMFAYRHLIKVVLKERAQHFWSYNCFGKEFGQHLEKKMILCTRIVKIVVSGGVFTICMFCLTTFFDKTKLVPLLCWTPESTALTGLIYFCQILMMLEIMHVLLGLDCFFLLICTDIRIQFILLQRAIKAINFAIEDDQKWLHRLVVCTKHHRFLLSFHEKINRIFSVYFIALYLITAACASMHSYIVMFKSPSISDTVKSYCYLSGMLFQVGLYFIITSNTEIEAENFADELYKINWEVCGDVKIRKHILFMLMKAQNPLSITGGGMLHVNRNEYVRLVRLAYSIATILGGMT